jgi:formate hydrogenlyase subunit 6/NADH:ubiquinone oxidoreductase subunit I
LVFKTFRPFFPTIEKTASFYAPYIPEDKDSPKIPVINVERCIGCGACENLCPARPFSAIYVEGHERHRII